MALLVLLSNVPGRVRFENSSLIGQMQLCRHLQKKIMEMGGVIDVSVNHRTGRILARFDESRIRLDPLIEQIEEVLNATAVFKLSCSLCCGDTSRCYKHCILKTINYNYNINKQKYGSDKNGRLDKVDKFNMNHNDVTDKIPLYIVRNFLIDMVSHMIIPKTFHALLPIIVHNLKKRPAL